MFAHIGLCDMSAGGATNCENDVGLFHLYNHVCFVEGIQDMAKIPKKITKFLIIMKNTTQLKVIRIDGDVLVYPGKSNMWRQRMNELMYKQTPQGRCNLAPLAKSLASMHMCAPLTLSNDV